MKEQKDLEKKLEEKVNVRPITKKPYDIKLRNYYDSSEKAWQPYDGNPKGVL